jgi:hypothetical protein
MMVVVSNSYNHEMCKRQFSVVDPFVAACLGFGDLGDQLSFQLGVSPQNPIK